MPWAMMLLMLVQYDRGKPLALVALQVANKYILASILQTQTDAELVCDPTTRLRLDRGSIGCTVHMGKRKELELEHVSQGNEMKKYRLLYLCQS